MSESFRDVVEGESNVEAEFDALTRILEIMKGLPLGTRTRLLKTVATFLDVGALQTTDRNETPRRNSGQDDVPTFSEDRSPSPKEFLLEKKPTTDVERIVCLAYYLTHYRNLPHFKTVDLSQLNTEAAQARFSNIHAATENAARARLLVPAAKGSKQITATGEIYVQSLPDRDAARKATSHGRPRKKSRKGMRSIVVDPSSVG